MFTMLAAYHRRRRLVFSHLQQLIPKKHDHRHLATAGIANNQELSRSLSSVPSLKATIDKRKVARLVASKSIKALIVLLGGMRSWLSCRTRSTHADILQSSLNLTTGYRRPTSDNCPAPAPT